VIWSDLSLTKTKGAMCANHIQTVIVGSGVIGLAIARKFARQGHEVLVLEAITTPVHAILK
jgi:NADPH-dependent 2,4-dienoyl-CoA reductase/sulfur reductase-like enzyme